MVSAFVFDIGNVLLRFDFQVALRRLMLQSRTPIEGLLEQIEPIKAAYEGARIARPEFVQQLFSLLGYRGNEADFVAAWEDIFEENTPMTRLVLSLSKNYPLFLISNIGGIHVDFILKQFPFFQHFSDAVYSYQAGCSKPEPAIYELAIKKFGIVPQTTVFIDDLEANVSAALDAGYQAIQYDFRQHRVLLNELERRGVEIEEEIPIHPVRLQERTSPFLGELVDSNHR